MGKVFIVAGVIVVVALIVWGISNYKAPPPVTMTLTVNKAWVDAEPYHTYYLIGGVDGAGKDRVIEMKEYFLPKDTNIDIEFSKIQTGKAYTFTCTGRQNLQMNQYYQCLVIVNK